VAKRKTARKTSTKRSSTKARATKRAKRPVAARGLDLKKVRADLLLAIAAMKKSPAAALGERAALDSDPGQLEEMVARINDFCERDRRCGTGMIIPI
jgi:hypothetical protein